VRLAGEKESSRWLRRSWQGEVSWSPYGAAAWIAIMNGLVQNYAHSHETSRVLNTPLALRAALRSASMETI
jgi:hypothetical protein